MAGAGFKTFNAGDVLSATDVNTYLMQQSVPVFASNGARGSAIAAPSQGMQTYLTSTASLYSYNGTYWLPVAPYSMEASSTFSVTTTASATWSTGTATVTFTANRFVTVSPIVTATANFTSSNPVVVQVQSVTSSGFTVRASIYANVAATIPINWTAVQMQSGSASG